MRALFIFALLLTAAPGLYAQDDALGPEAEKLFDRIERRPERAWDYQFSLRQLAEHEDGESVVPVFEAKLESEDDHVRMVASHLVLLYGEPMLAYMAWPELLMSEDDDVVEATARMITWEGPEDDEVKMGAEIAWEESTERSAGVRTALCEALLVNQDSELALEQLREFLSSGDHELVGRAALVLAERGYEDEVKGRIDSLASEPGDVGRLARIGQEIAGADQAVEDFKTGRIRRKDKLIEVEIRAIKKHYVDDSFVYNNDEYDLDSENLIDNAGRAMARATDRYGAMMTQAELDEMNEDQRGRYVGIGAHVAEDDDGILYVTQPIYEGPGYEAGLRTGDKLIGILGPDGERIDLTELNLEEAVEHVRGPEGTTATVYIERRGEDEEVVLDIERRVVRVDTALEEMLPGNVGYVRLTRFGGNSAKDMKESLDNLRRLGMKSLILDLRNNGGGQLGEVIEIADMFLPKGAVISSAGGRYGDWKGRSEPWRSDGGRYTEIPMACLINESSASGAEMLSGALKDNNRAVVIGKPTFGKGVGQSFFRVDGHAARILKVTVFRYFLPSGISIDRYEGEGGVSPHIDVDAELLEPWQVYAVHELRDGNRLEEYLDEHYRGANKAQMMKLAEFDGLDASKWPEFEEFYAGLDTMLDEEDVRRELRFALRARVQDDRGAEFTQNFQEDPAILRGVQELYKKLNKDPKAVPEYKTVME